MRESIARFVCGLSLALVVALAGLFALRHNPRLPAAPPPPISAIGAARRDADTGSPAQLARGRDLFGELDCATCHSFHGRGNPRRPLDESGARLTAEELSARITGTGAAASTLSPAVVKRKQRYQSLPHEDIAALVAWLSSPAPAVSEADP